MDMTAAQRNEKALQGLTDLDGLLNRDASKHAPDPSEDRRPFIIGWGLVAALRRQAHAVAALYELKLGHEAAPNRRLMIEYMAQLHWLAEDGGIAVDSMNKKFQNDHGKLHDSIETGGVFTYDAELAALADEVKKTEIAANPANTYNGTSHLLTRLGSGLDEVWRSETQHSHSGIPAARVFFDDSDESSVRLCANPRHGDLPNPDDLSPFMAFMLLFCGVEAFDKLMVDSPWCADLRKIGIRAGLIDPANEPDANDAA
ncbi:hypothetical protein [Streptomyces sp. NPDC057426]|uniref:hypothetical protein n=1 Tax=Streptomyces sp. NPDC057426 TaxID=3346128 RepID=UPI0036D17C69